MLWVFEIKETYRDLTVTSC